MGWESPRRLHGVSTSDAFDLSERPRGPNPGRIGRSCSWSEKSVHMQAGELSAASGVVVGRTSKLIILVAGVAMKSLPGRRPLPARQPPDPLVERRWRGH